MFFYKLCHNNTINKKTIKVSCPRYQKQPQPAFLYGAQKTSVINAEFPRAYIMQGKKGHYATNYAISAEFHLEYYHFIHINVKNIRNSAWCLQSLIFCPDNALPINFPHKSQEPWTLKSGSATGFL